jgi:hypothetical protein
MYDMTWWDNIKEHKVYRCSCLMLYLCWYKFLSFHRGVCWSSYTMQFCRWLPTFLKNFYRCLHPVVYITVINLCYHLSTLFLFIVLFSTLHVSTSAGHRQVFHIYHTTTVLRARFTSSCFKSPLVCIHIRLPVLFHPWYHSMHFDQLIIKW